MNIQELNSFRMADAITFHDSLNPKLWNNNKLRPEVKKQLEIIAQDFLMELGVNELDVTDITVSGSNAAYSYTPHSDLDLHILVNLKDLPNNEVYKELFNAKKTLYNDSHDIKIHGVPVELYVQDASEPVVSLGEYSIKNDKWLKIPSKRRANFDQAASKLKYNKLLELIQHALSSGKLKKVQKIITKIKQYRQAGLDKGGEFGPENLAYKALRSQGYITKLYKLRDKLHSEKLTIETMYKNIADEDYDPNGPPPGPEFKPTMPAGTVKVDVSDVYDWYKLGQHVSNLKGLGKHDFGKGPPSTIMAFGDEDTEHEYIKDLEKTGLTTTDIDPFDPNQPKGMKRQKVDPTFNVNEKMQDLEKNKFPEKKIVDIIQKLIPMAKEIWFHGSRATGKHRPDSDTDILVVVPDNIVGENYLEIVLALQAIAKKFHNYDIQPTKTSSNIYRIAREEGILLWPIKQPNKKYIPKKVVEDETLQFAAEKTPPVNPYGGIKDRQYRGGISEGFDQPYPLKWEKSEYGDVDALAILPDGSPLSIMFNKQQDADGDEIVQVEFYRNNSQEVTGEGDAMRIFATVLTAIQKYIKKYKPARLSFSAAKQVEQGQNAESRAKLYDRLVQRYARAWGYRAFRADNGDIVIYELSRMSNVVVAKEDETLQYAAEKTPVISPYAGVKERQFRGSISENSMPKFVYHVTPTRNLKSIAKQGLTPTVGDRASQISGEKSGIYVFPDQVSAEDAVMNWLGDEFDDEPLTMLKIDISGLEKNISKGADYELIVGTMIEPSRIKKLNVQLEEASGYIPSEKEKNDPRFKTALTVDVRPYTMKKDAKKFGNKISRAGIPPTANPSGKF